MNPGPVSFPGFSLGGPTAHRAVAQRARAGLVARDLPAVVVHEHVVVSAEEDSAPEVGLAVIPMPVVDVVGFPPARWSVAAGDEASAVSGGEEALFAAEVEGVAEVEGLGGDEQARGWLAGTDDAAGGWGVGGAGEAQQVGESVVHVLVDRAVIGASTVTACADGRGIRPGTVFGA